METEPTHPSDDASDYASTSTVTDTQGSPANELLQGASFTARDLAYCSSDEARSFVPYADARKLNILPLSLAQIGKKPRLHIAATESSLEFEGECHYVCGLPVLITTVPAHLLTEAIEVAYLGCEERLARHVGRLQGSGERRRLDPVDQIEVRGDAALFLTAILEFAAIREASDIHLVPQRDGAIIKLRIDGEILTQRQEPYALTFHEQIVSRLKVLSGIDITSRSVPHDGSFSFILGNSRRSARLSTLPTVHGESVVVRLLCGTSVTAIGELGFEPSALYLLRDSIACNEGLILLTGPTGSGKTTTLYSLVHELDSRGRNVVAVEDPVETQIPGIVQVQVNPDVGLDYPRAIRSVLRHDPDVLLIGEIRDGLSGSMAIDAATTGHLTVSSLHVGSVFDVVRRLEILGAPPIRVVPALRLILNQRLLPQRCKSCASKTCENQRIDVCLVCRGTGYAGQVVVTEALDMRHSSAQDAFLRGASGETLRHAISDDAYIPWSEALHYHSSRGSISIEQVREFYSGEW